MRRRATLPHPLLCWISSFSFFCLVIFSTVIFIVLPQLTFITSHNIIIGFHVSLQGPNLCGAQMWFIDAHHLLSIFDPRNYSNGFQKVVNCMNREQMRLSFLCEERKKKRLSVLWLLGFQDEFEAGKKKIKKDILFYKSNNEQIILSRPRKSLICKTRACRLLQFWIQIEILCVSHCA